jgi:hypothetical protein
MGPPEGCPFVVVEGWHARAARTVGALRSLEVVEQHGAEVIQAS